ncbi:hypothetical protein PAXRUDRAFT_367371 [Paxillus rubicundulus Ve08.2h10]|uniref:Uncharacterized protein n=1 Tax=Paxillus rubicundulus Ve08.2h10 TaxID=930991 RepID=A0A0D0E9C6_9AGAM|nr:hypothetical protein PAXRUDRAFT_367371 [Paxillus rubicundulus Ve08.2h10]
MIAQGVVSHLQAIRKAPGILLYKHAPSGLATYPSVRRFIDGLEGHGVHPSATGQQWFFLARWIAFGSLRVWVRTLSSARYCGQRVPCGIRRQYFTSCNLISRNCDNVPSPQALTAAQAGRIPTETKGHRSVIADSSPASSLLSSSSTTAYRTHERISHGAIGIGLSLVHKTRQYARKPGSRASSHEGV